MAFRVVSAPVGNVDFCNGKIRAKNYLMSKESFDNYDDATAFGKKHCPSCYSFFVISEKEVEKCADADVLAE